MKKKEKQEERKRASRIKKIEEEIENAESRITQIDQEAEGVSSDYIALQALYEEKTALEEKCNLLLEEWEKPEPEN